MREPLALNVRYIRKERGVDGYQRHPYSADSRYGAVLSTSLGIREVRRERKKIHISLELHFFTKNTFSRNTSSGFRPFTITDIGMKIFYQ